MATRALSFTLNGAATRLTVDEDRPLLWVLRDDLGLTGTKFGCGEAHCGSCTVLVDDRAVRSCAVPVREVEGKRLITVEGLAREGVLHPVQEAFLKHLAYQCGFCTPGLILGACALLHENPRPSREDIVRSLDAHLCRCGAHVRIVDAVESAAAAMRGGAR
jgi:aerobic-type carbon monoxide dehydrogenase small subunit (CoxS/CutS family)